jgi:predicted nucleic acid-binding protein
MSSWHRISSSPRSQAREILRDFLRIKLAVQATKAVRRGLTVYDALYLALAVTRRCQMVTADQKLYGATRPGRLSAQVLWVADVPPPTSSPSRH